MLHGTYIGPLEHLKGKGALLIDRDTFFLAQFDDIMATISGIPSDFSLGMVWSEWVKEHWSIDD